MSGPVVTASTPGVANSFTATQQGLTPAEIESIRAEATKKNLKTFNETNPQNRFSNNVYLLVKKAVLHS
jgi:hypothetical protein